jgi:hypothetical protein
VGSSCGPLLAREKDLRNGWRAEPTPSLNDPDLLLPPDPDSLLFRGAYESRKMSLRWQLSDRRRDGRSSWSSCPHTDGRRWRRGFPSTTRRPMSALIVGAPHRGSAVGVGCSAARPSRSEPLRRTRPGWPAGRRRRRTWTCAERSRKRPDERPDRASVMRAYALIAAVRGAGVSRG